MILQLSTMSDFIHLLAGEPDGRIFCTIKEAEGKPEPNRVFRYVLCSPRLQAVYTGMCPLSRFEEKVDAPLSQFLAQNPEHRLDRFDHLAVVERENRITLKGPLPLDAPVE